MSIRDEEPIDADYRDPDEGGCPHCRDPKACEECAIEREHDQHIDYLNKMLGEQVADATRGTANAVKWLTELTSPAVYDIEFAEGWEGSDALADLEAAGKLLRNVQRIVNERQRLLKENGRCPSNR
jgi:hypothetical protein